jgi:hypothetical protein
VDLGTLNGMKYARSGVMLPMIKADADPNRPRKRRSGSAAAGCAGVMGISLSVSCAALRPEELQRCMPGKSSEVVAHREQFMVARNRRHGDQTVRPRRGRARRQALVSEPRRIDMIACARVHDAERGEQATLQVRELPLTSNAAQNFLQDYRRKAQGYVSGHQLRDYRLNLSLLGTHTPATEDAGQD